MEHTVENDLVIFFPGPRMDAANAEEIDEAIHQVMLSYNGMIPVIDMSGVSYISSAGLRTLLKIRKRYGPHVNVIKASEELYDIFIQTGFNKLIKIQTPERYKAEMGDVTVDTVDISVLEHISGDNVADMYRIDDESVLRLYSENIPLDFIMNNKRLSSISLKSGVPISISYNIVRSGERYGIIFESDGADTLIDQMASHREDLKEYTQTLAQWTRRINSIDVRAADLNSSVNSEKRLLSELMKSGFLKTDEYSRLLRVLDNIPAGHTYAHHDLTPHNIAVQNGEYIVLDAFMAGQGHPIQDVSSMAWYFKLLPEMGIKSQASVFTDEENRLIWRTFLSTYLESSDERYLLHAEQQIIQFAYIRYLMVEAVSPGFADKRDLLKIKRAAVGYSDIIEPLCF